MILKRIKVNAGAIMGINCYIVQDENTKETILNFSSSILVSLFEHPVKNKQKTNKHKKIFFI